MSKIEEPEYEIVASDGPFEIRNYRSMIVAETEVRGERSSAINEGFRLIAGYIFGNNRTRGKIAMTAPVQQQMTAVAPEQPRQSRDGTWAVRFVMPKSWTMATLPPPNDPRVRLSQVPAQKWLAIRFSGFASSRSIGAKERALRAYARAKGIETTGEPILAFYNPPWTLPFLRRNEILVAVTGG
ncbi:MAG TPA: heme-binding protein [Devosiaceae bacterium]